MKLILALVLSLLAAPAAAQDAFDVSRAVLEGGSPSVADRAITATVTQVNFTDDGVVIDFTKREGPNRWPDVVPPGWDGPIEYTLWIGMQLQGQWHVCGVIEFWFGRGIDADKNAGSNVTLNQQIQRNWTYFCGPMARQPNPGEPVAFFVTSGDQRRMDVAAVRERSNVVVVPFPASAPAVFPMSALLPPVFTQPPISAPPAPPASPPSGPAPVTVQAPATLPSTDLSVVYAQLAAIRSQLDVTAQELHTLKVEVEANWTRYVAPVLKYAAAIAVGILAKWKM